ncbi:MAG: hypothetical protein LBT01_05525 [Spirochaetaceae bacterium]|jgi:hypothetical protein|nr:hypothetical protein [Spirochaetaceae bacterium]
MVQKSYDKTSEFFSLSTPLAAPQPTQAVLASLLVSDGRLSAHCGEKPRPQFETGMPFFFRLYFTPRKWLIKEAAPRTANNKKVGQTPQRSFL